jgi:hypothetical protein
MFSGGIIAIISMLVGIFIGLIFGLFVGLKIRRTAEKWREDQLTTLRVGIGEIRVRANPKSVDAADFGDAPTRPWGKPRIFVDDRCSGFEYPEGTDEFLEAIKRSLESEDPR